MSQIKGKWTKQEKLIHNYLKGKKIQHKMHPKIKGNPDIIFKKKKIAIFIDGCFWHGCPEHGRVPTTANSWYWPEKIASNMRRDQDTNRALAEAGWTALRCWEHEDPDAVAERIRAAVRERAGRQPEGQSGI